MKVLVSSINFAPDHAGIGLYSTDFPVYLAEQNDQVSMVTGFPYYPRWEKSKEDNWKFFKTETYQGVKVFRGFLYVPTRKVNALRRLIHELSFCMFAAINFLRAGKHDAIVIFSPPFFLGLVGLIAKWIWRVPLIINVQDLPLDAALALGMLKPSLATRIFQGLENWIYRNADMVCSISPTMIRNVQDKGVRPDRIKLVPNWIDVKKAAVGKEKGLFISKHPQAAGKFTIAYAGNIGIKQGIDVLVRVAKELENNPEFHFFIIGEGADKPRMLELAKELGITNITFLPFLNPSEYQEMLSDVDVIFVAQRSGAGNNFSPSKLLGLMARSKALLIAADADSELAKVISQSECGMISSYDDVAAIVANIKQMQGMQDGIASMGMRGSEAVQQFDREAILSQWRASIGELISQR